MLRAILAIIVTVGLFAADPAGAIRKVLEDQQAAWNRGDVRAFMTGYEDSPDTTFIGSSVARGYKSVMERYLKSYPAKDKMGILTFSEIEVRMLGPDYATVLGRFHLDRSKEGGGPAQGIFTLLFKRITSGWKIIQDHTSPVG